MGTLIELLATKKKAAASQTPEPAMLLPVVQKEHEGECGDGCACGGSEGGGCCGS